MPASSRRWRSRKATGERWPPPRARRSGTRAMPAVSPERASSSSASLVSPAPPAPVAVAIETGAVTPEPPTSADVATISRPSLVLWLLIRPKRSARARRAAIRRARWTARTRAVAAEPAVGGGLGSAPVAGDAAVAGAAEGAGGATGTGVASRSAGGEGGGIGMRSTGGEGGGRSGVPRPSGGLAAFATPVARPRQTSATSAVLARRCCDGVHLGRGITFLPSCRVAARRQRRGAAGSHRRNGPSLCGRRHGSRPGARSDPWSRG